MWLLLTSLVFADPTTVVVVGDVPMVAVGEGAPAVDAMPGGWVSVVGDCMDEWRPNDVVVVDRTVAGESALDLQQRVDDVRGLQPDILVVSLGATELRRTPTEPGPFVASLSATLDMMSPQEHPTLVVGLLPGQTTVPVGLWNQAIHEASAHQSNIAYVDLMAQWPVEAEKRAPLMGDEGALSPRGHAMVGAHVCRAIQQAMSVRAASEKLPTAPANEAPTPNSE